MNKVLFILIFASTLSHADESCLFPPCPPPPTEAEFKAVDTVFKQAKYILGAAYDVQNNNNGSTYKNIPGFVKKTKRIKNDIKALSKKAEKLNRAAGGFEMVVVINTIDMCIAFDKKSIQYCSQALNELKSYHWKKSFGTNWSGYPISAKWNGFPKVIK